MKDREEVATIGSNRGRKGHIDRLFSANAGQGGTEEFMCDGFLIFSYSAVCRPPASWHNMYARTLDVFTCKEKFLLYARVFFCGTLRRRR